MGTIELSMKLMLFFVGIRLGLALQKFYSCQFMLNKYSGTFYVNFL